MKLELEQDLVKWVATLIASTVIIISLVVCSVLIVPELCRVSAESNRLKYINQNHDVIQLKE